jgi:hypothetical protein
VREVVGLQAMALVATPGSMVLVRVEAAALEELLQDLLVHLMVGMVVAVVNMVEEAVFQEIITVYCQIPTAEAEVVYVLSGLVLLVHSHQQILAIYKYY